MKYLSLENYIKLENGIFSVWNNGSWDHLFKANLIKFWENKSAVHNLRVMRCHGDSENVLCFFFCLEGKEEIYGGEEQWTKKSEGKIVDAKWSILNWPILEINEKGIARRNMSKGKTLF
jgi:hypothetical protein